MELLAIASALSQFVPAITKWITGSEKASEAAGAVVDIAKQVTGLADAKNALTAIQGDPRLQFEYKQAVMMQELTLDQLYLADVQNARAMQIAALGQEDLFSKRFVHYFAAAWSLFAAVYFVCVTFIEVPETGQRVADTILGVLIGSVLGTIFQFFYGSTRANKVKDETIKNLTR